MGPLRVTRHEDQLLLDVHVVPKASRSAVIGVYAGRLKIALAAPPVDGAANAALLRFLADALGIAKRQVTLLRGEHSRQKTVAISGVSLEQVRSLALA